MANVDITLLDYLGKHVIVKLPVTLDFDPSGFIEESGKITAICFELDSDHQFCMKLDSWDDQSEYFKFSETTFLQIV